MNQLLNRGALHHFIRQQHVCTKKLPVTRTKIWQRRDFALRTFERPEVSCFFVISPGPDLPQPTLSSRFFHTSVIRFDQPSSKVEEVVESLKQKEKDKVKEKVKTVTDVAAETATPVVVAPVAKKTLVQRIWAELVHYYHGFRLLFIDINIGRKLLWRVLNGKSLTRREHKMLIRTTSDIFRLVPFSVFIIVPFMELLLPLAIKFFPGMLPSTFQTSSEREDKLKQNLKVKIEMAKFLQKTLDEMTVAQKDHRSEEAKKFSEFFNKVRAGESTASSDEILKFSKLFEDELTLDSLTRQQLTALCRVLEINTLGTSAVLKFQLDMKLRSLAADDRVIQKEGIESLDLPELQNACRARAMRAYGLSEEQLKFQLQEWIDLSINEKVPPSLLLLSRALLVPENVPTSDKLRATISALPETVATQAKAAIGEKEGKIDNKTKIEIIKEEQRKIIEEKEELQEAEREKAAAEVLVDSAPVIAEKTAAKEDTAPILVAEKIADKAKEDELSTADLEVLENALESIGKDKRKLLLEKEEIKDLKEEIADYKEDVTELLEVVGQSPENAQIKETAAAKLLYKKVNSMISGLDTVLENLEQTEQKLKKEVKQFEESTESESLQKTQEELVRIDELMMAIKQIQKVPDDSRAAQIEKILGKMDVDHDGKIAVDDVLKVIETIGQDDIKLQPQQVDELIDLLAKEEEFETEKKIQKALAKTLEQGKLPETPKEIMEDTHTVIEPEPKPQEEDVGKHILKAPSSEELVDKAKTISTTSIPTIPPTTGTRVASSKTKDTSL